MTIVTRLSSAELGQFWFNCSRPLGVFQGKRCCDVIKGEQRTSLQKLTAPVDGMVQQLAIHTIGGVVTPAQALMLIVPAETTLRSRR